jgi:Zn finger protein HypA/HybF involved in hydrogenase expression
MTDISKDMLISFSKHIFKDKFEYLFIPTNTKEYNIITLLCKICNKRIRMTAEDHILKGCCKCGSQNILIRLKQILLMKRIEIIK